MDIMLERVISLIPNKRGAKKELSDAIGIPANLLSEWAAGRNKSYTKYLPQIAGYYGVSLDWLSGLSDEKEYKKIPAGVSADGGMKIDISDLTGKNQEKVKEYIDLLLNSQRKEEP